MNEQLQKFINDMGAMCELWMVIYSGFVKLGMGSDEALKHTQAFMTATFNSIMPKGGAKEG